MKLSALAFAVVAAQGLASSARAGEVACWYEQGVLIAPASVAGVAGDYILDTGSPATQLHETMAQGAGIAQTSLAGEVRLAGLTLPARPLAVANLDSRTWLFPTPIAGVIGADILGDYVVDVSFAPCRVSIRPAREAPPFTARTTLRLGRLDGAATAFAAVSDGPRAFGGPFVVATGADASVRLDPAFARVEGKAKPLDLLPGGERRAELRAASFAGVLFENVDAGLAPVDIAAAGVIGAPMLAHWRVRFDFPRRRLLLAPAG